MIVQPATRIGIVVAIATFVATIPPLGMVAATADDQPNILVFVTDDQRPEGTMAVMPQTRHWFQDGGTYFPNGFVTTPLCCPARSSNFSGRYAHNHGVKDNVGQGHLDMTTTVQRYLHDAGYHTGFAGKFLNFYDGPVPPQYFDVATLNESYVSGGTYNTNILREKATADLSGWEADDDAPWLLFVAPKAPHSPFKPEAQYANAPVPARVSNPALTAGTAGKPPAIGLIQASPGEAESARVAQLRTLMSVDDMVEAIMNQLVTLGEDQRTLAFFLSDNGYVWGEFGIEPTKRLPYPVSTGVPFFMRWPGHVPEGVTDQRFAANIDLAPTMLEAAGLPAPTNPPMDGVSLLQPDVRDRLPLEYFVTADGKLFPSWASTMTHAYQYTEWYAANLQDITFREYYDLANDPWETTNLLANGTPDDDPDVAAMSAALAVDRVCSGSACFEPTVADTNPPDPPGNLSASDVGGVALSWTAPHDDVGVTGYEVRRDGNPIATIGASTSYTDGSAPSTGMFSYDVVALDRAGNRSDPSAPAEVSRQRTILFADGFESGTANAWPTRVRLSAQQAEVSVGSWAGELLAPGTPAYGRAALTSASATGDLHLRFRLQSRGAHAVIVCRLITSTGLGARAFITSDGRLGYVNEVANKTHKSTTQVSQGVWHDLELAVRTGAAGHVTVRLDGVIVAGLDRTEAMGSNGLGSLQIGDSTAHRTFDLLVDDVDVSSLA